MQSLYFSYGDGIGEEEYKFDRFEDKEVLDYSSTKDIRSYNYFLKFIPLNFVNTKSGNSVETYTYSMNHMAKNFVADRHAMMP